MSDLLSFFGRMKKVPIVCGVLVVLLGAGGFFYGAFHFTSVCPICGEIRETTEWKVPETEITMFSHSAEQATPVSALLQRIGLVAPHQHQWLFCQGSGNGIFCAIGKGRHLLPATKSQEVATVIEASQKFGELSFRDQVVGALLDSSTAPLVYEMGFIVPQSGFSNKAEFQKWLGENKPPFEEMLAKRQTR